MGSNSNRYPYIAGIDYESVSDGIGVRTAIFLSGCRHHCINCHNPETWDAHFGTLCTDKLIQSIAEEYVKRPYLSGITLTGGDPLYCVAKTQVFFVKLAGEIFARSKKLVDLWIYTGYTYEEIRKKASQDVSLRLLLHPWASVLVDGRFDISKADKRLAFCGSSNQRLINVKASYDEEDGSFLKKDPVLWNPSKFDSKE